MDHMREILSDAKAAADAVAGMPEPGKLVWGTVTDAYPDEYRVRFDTQTSSHPVIAPDPCRPGDRVLCTRMGRQTIITNVITRPWRYPQLFNGWQVSGSHRQLAYRRQGDIVYWRGVVTAGNLEFLICRVDVDCRPMDSLAVMNGGWGIENRALRVATDGAIRLSTTGTVSSSWISFDGAYYSVV